MQEEEQQTPIMTYRTGMYVWCALVVLLGFTIAIARMQLFAKYSVLAALLIASTKAAQGIAYFMHLLYEGKRLQLMLRLTVSLFTLIIAMMFIDIPLTEEELKTIINYLKGLK